MPTCSSPATSSGIWPSWAISVVYASAALNRFVFGLGVNCSQFMANLCLCSSAASSRRTSDSPAPSAWPTAVAAVGRRRTSYP